MPIMNMIVSGGSSPTPTFTGIEVEVVNGVMQKTPTQTILDFTGVTEIQNMYGVYYNVSQLNIPNGVINMGDVETIGATGLESAFLGCNYSGVDLGSLTTIAGAGLYRAFMGGIGNNITVDLHSLETISDGALEAAFLGTAVTSLDLSSLTTIGDYNDFNACTQAFQSTALSSISLPNLDAINGIYSAQQMFAQTPLVSVSMPKLRKIGYGGQYTTRYMFNNCTLLTTVDWRHLWELDGTAPLYQTFVGCSALTTLNLSSLAYLSANGACQQMLYGCESLTDLKLPNIRTDAFSPYVNQFVNMCVGIPYITIHFPSNVQSVVEGLTGYSTTAPFGADAGTVLFDLPATVTLTGIVNGNSYNFERAPEFDTNTSLGWIMSGISLNEPYYTSGTTDPVVGDTIYSDDACTVSVTTIDSIA